jgi:hypothetical protein
VDNERWRTDNESMANNFGDRGSGPLNPSKANYWIAGVLASSLLLTACASTSSGVDDTVTSFTKLEHEWAQSKVSWVDADLALLTKTCVSLTPSLRRRLDAAGDGNAIAAFDDRKATCESVSQWRTSLAGLQNHALTSTSGDEIERIQGGLAELRETVDSAIQAFPTSAFREAKFASSASGPYRAKHEAVASEGGTVAANAVALSRDASGGAMKTASSSDHELDKARARLADEAYTKSSSELTTLASYSSPSEVVSHVDEILSTVDGAIGNAQVTGQVGGNPVTAARESVPSAVPSLAPTAQPTNDVALTGANMNAVNVSSGIANARSLVLETKQISIISSLGCQSEGGLQIRFKDDGTGGCADLRRSLHALLNSGNTVDIIPVAASGKGTIFGLLYSEKRSGAEFIGILPGDGSGNLDVRVDGGDIVEQNGASVKRSTFQNGRVVPI